MKGGALKQVILAFAILVTISGCATEGKYKAILNAWIGSSEYALIKRWGVPINSYETGGKKFLVFSSRQDIVMPGASPTYSTTVIGNTAYTSGYGGTPDQHISMGCTTTFEIENEKVVNWSYRGNDCTAM